MLDSEGCYVVLVLDLEIPEFAFVALLYLEDLGVHQIDFRIDV